MPSSGGCSSVVTPTRFQALIAMIDAHQVAELLLAELGGGGVVDVVGHAAVRQPRHRLGQRERCALALVEERALAPGREREDAAVVLAGLLRVDAVHVDAERAAVDLGGADAHELAQARLEGGARVERGDGAVDVARRAREVRFGRSCHGGTVDSK